MKRCYDCRHAVVVLPVFGGDLIRIRPLRVECRIGGWMKLDGTPRVFKSTKPLEDGGSLANAMCVDFAESQVPEGTWKEEA